MEGTSPPLGEFHVAVGPLHGVRCSAPGKCFGPYIMWVNLPTVLCMGFAHGFAHYDFLPMVFCRFSQGKYSYVLSKG